MEQDLLDVGAYFTHSKRLPKKLRKCRIPRSASTNITYHKQDSTSEVKPTKPKRKPKNTPPPDSPSASRVRSQQLNTETPKVHPLAQKLNSTPVSTSSSSDKQTDSDATIELPSTEVPNVESRTKENSTKGQLAVQSYTLRKVKKV